MNLTDTIEITVSIRKGRQTIVTKDTVAAKRYGPLALHKDIMQGKRQLWRITHIASGLQVLSELPLKAAVAITKELKELPEWAEPTLASEQPDREVLTKLANIVREARSFHCFGVAREAA